MKDVIEFVQQLAGQGHLPDNAALTSLQGRDVGDAAVDVDRRWRERQDFGNPASAQTQDKAKELDFRGRATRRLGEAPPFGGVEVLTVAG